MPSRLGQASALDCHRPNASPDSQPSDSSSSLTTDTCVYRDRLLQVPKPKATHSMLSVRAAEPMWGPIGSVQSGLCEGLSYSQADWETGTKRSRPRPVPGLSVTSPS